MGSEVAIVTVLCYFIQNNIGSYCFLVLWDGNKMVKIDFGLMPSYQYPVEFWCYPLCLVLASFTEMHNEMC